jgi:hypothetical protein
MALVYLVTNTVTGNRYVGVTKKDIAYRKRKHESAARRKEYDAPFINALRKHPSEAFRWEVLSTHDTSEDALIAEIDWIARLKPEYNVTLGGQGMHGTRHTDEWRVMMSKRRKNHNPGQAIASESKKKSIICLNDGMIFKSIMEAALYYNVGRAVVEKSAREGIATKGGLCFQFGTIFVPIGVDGIIEKARTKLAKSFDQGHNSKRKKVLAVELNMVFDSATEAAKYFGITPEGVSLTIKRGGANKQGIKLRYLDEGAS